MDLDGSNQHMWRGQNSCDMHDGHKTSGELMTNHGTFGDSTLKQLYKYPHGES
jgi:hypothetical protein